MIQIVDKGVLPFLLMSLEKPDEREEKWTARLLKNLSANNKICLQIKKETTLMRVLKSCAENSKDQVQIACRETLRAIEEQCADGEDKNEIATIVIQIII